MRSLVLLACNTVLSLVFHYFYGWRTGTRALVCWQTVFDVTAPCAFGDTRRSEELTRWLEIQRVEAVERILANVGPAGARRGCVVAATSKTDPPYFFHWVRDAAIVMDALLCVLETETRNGRRGTGVGVEVERALWDYVDFSNYIVSQGPTPSAREPSDPFGVGEPKFWPSGAPYEGPWGRPQNDGPALRVALASRFAAFITKQDGEAGLRRVRRSIFNGSLLASRPPPLAVAVDIAMLQASHTTPCFDAWEEVQGVHYYTTAVQAYALSVGAVQLANLINDTLLSKTAFEAGQAAYAALPRFVKFNSLVPTLDASLIVPVGRRSRLDILVILAALHARANLSDPLLLDYASRIEAVGQGLYAVNLLDRDYAAPAVGRYPEDVYRGGNPWFLATLGLAEFHYKLGKDALVSHNLAAARERLQHGDRFLERVRMHAGADGRMDEQIDRDTGYMISAANLTWSYAALLTAADSRGSLVDAITRLS